MTPEREAEIRLNLSINRLRYRDTVDLLSELDSLRERLQQAEAELSAALADAAAMRDAIIKDHPANEYVESCAWFECLACDREWDYDEHPNHADAVDVSYQEVFKVWKKKGQETARERIGFKFIDAVRSSGEGER